MKIILPFVLMVLGACAARAQTTTTGSSSTASLPTLVFDWKTKSLTSGSLPFDEAYCIKIQNLDNTIKSVTINIKRSGGLKSDPGELIDTGTITSDDPQCYFEKYLSPNTTYRIEFNVQTNAPLSKDQSDKLISYLQGNQSFKTEVLTKVGSVDYSNLSVTMLNPILVNYVQQYNKGYTVDVSKISDQAAPNAVYQAAIISNDFIKDSSAIATLVSSLQGYSTCKATHAWTKDQVKAISGSLFSTAKSYMIKGVPWDTFWAVVTKFVDSCTKGCNQDTVKINENTVINTITDSYNSVGPDIIKWVDSSVAAIAASATSTFRVLASTDQVNNTNSSPYFSQTFGYGFSPGTNVGLLYFTFSCFLRPVNSNVPFNHVPKSERWKVRWCVNFGLTLDDISTNNHGIVSGLGSIFGNKAGLLGIGYRPLPFVKFDLNSMLYYQNDPNPLINHKKFVASPLIGISLNLNIIKILAGQPNSLTTLQKSLKN